MKFPCCAPTSVCEIRDGKFTSYEITPEQFGYERCEKGALTGGTPAENAEITKAILKGEEKGPKRQAVCLNAGAALYIAGKATYYRRRSEAGRIPHRQRCSTEKTGRICRRDK